MKLDVLKEQVILAHQKTNNLIKSVSANRWMETPDVLWTNLNWQIGHIVLANYLHGIASISGPSDTFRTQVHIADFVKFYGPKSIPKEFVSEKPSTTELLAIYEFTYRTILEEMENLTEEDLKRVTEVPNPAVKTKYEALLWVSQHQSWHNGQIATLKRILVE